MGVCASGDDKEARVEAAAKALAESELQLRLTTDHLPGQQTQVTLYGIETVGESLKRVAPICWLLDVSACAGGAASGDARLSWGGAIADGVLRCGATARTDARRSIDRTGASAGVWFGCDGCDGLTGSVGQGAGCEGDPDAEGT